MDTCSNSNNNANPVTSEESSLKIINLEENEDKKESQDETVPVPSSISLSSNESKKANITNLKEKKDIQKSAKKNKNPNNPEKKNDLKEDSETPVNSTKKEKKDNKKNELIIEIPEEAGKNSSTPEKGKTGKKSKKKKTSEKPAKKRGPNLGGYSPFTFYEKEKFKEINCKEINARQYVSEISLKWRNMSDEEKEPYAKMALDFMKSQNLLDKDGEPVQMIKKKRKRPVSQGDKGHVEKKKEKKEKKPGKNKSEKDSKCVSSDEKKNKTERKESNGLEIEEKIDDSVRDYIYSVFVPFVDKSYEFFNSRGLLKSDK